MKTKVSSVFSWVPSSIAQNYWSWACHGPSSPVASKMGSLHDAVLVEAPGGSGDVSREIFLIQAAIWVQVYHLWRPKNSREGQETNCHFQSHSQRLWNVDHLFIYSFLHSALIECWPCDTGLGARNSVSQMDIFRFVSTLGPSRAVYIGGYDRQLTSN